MSMAQIGTQVEYLGKAARKLMSLTLPPEKRVSGAMAELGFGFLENPPFRETSEHHVERIRSIMSGPGSHEEIARRLDYDKLEALGETFWRLDREVMHAFYRAMYQTHDAA